MRAVGLVVILGFTAASLPLWAADVAAPGVPNFHQVNERIYRGAQPKGEGWSSLASLGVKTVIDLRRESEHSSKAEARAVQAAGMHYVNVPLSNMAAPSDKKIAQVLALLDDSAGPVFVHCRRGADRTGTVIACYRIAHGGWSNQQALREALSYGMSWVEVGMQRYVLAFHAAGAPPTLPPSAAQPPLN
jgi:tyrosine-protein phosphatase SIW14